MNNAAKDLIQLFDALKEDFQRYLSIDATEADRLYGEIATLKKTIAAQGETIREFYERREADKRRISTLEGDERLFNEMHARSTETIANLKRELANVTVEIARHPSILRDGCIFYRNEIEKRETEIAKLNNELKDALFNIQHGEPIQCSTCKDNPNNFDDADGQGRR